MRALHPSGIASQCFIDVFMFSSLVRRSGSRLFCWAMVVPCRGRSCLREHLFAAIAVHDILDDLNAEPGSRGRIDPAIDMREWPRNEVMLHGISERLELEQLAGRRI